MKIPDNMGAYLLVVRIVVVVSPPRFSLRSPAFLSAVVDYPSLSTPHLSLCLSDSSTTPPRLAFDDRYR